MEHNEESFERAMSDAEMEAKKSFLEIHYKRFEAWDRWDAPGYCEYLSDDIQFILESATSDSINATGIEAVTNILNGCRDALNSDPFDGFWHETKSVKFIKITENCVKAEIFFHIWQRIKATHEWKQQIFNKMVDKEPKLGRFPIFVTTERRDGKWLVTEQRANTDD